MMHMYTGASADGPTDNRTSRRRHESGIMTYCPDQDKLLCRDEAQNRGSLGSWNAKLPGDREKS